MENGTCWGERQGGDRQPGLSAALRIVSPVQPGLSRLLLDRARRARPRAREKCTRASIASESSPSTFAVAASTVCTARSNSNGCAPGAAMAGAKRGEPRELLLRRCACLRFFGVSRAASRVDDASWRFKHAVGCDRRGREGLGCFNEATRAGCEKHGPSVCAPGRASGVRSRQTPNVKAKRIRWLDQLYVPPRRSLCARERESEARHTHRAH